ncbi:hypothetical protein BCR35DRAFT_300550 [Leucosporidium creatinivorum]|uniref:Uncharacterized protein n=1 Tax=Leucosporidium creatinivorum TaxID=106004 RepID=A0A1Y2FZ52_9BASI|nr:hypothetical protein BCR35DRAFT_300550 [Leucosporidium creatinivorum]
MWSIQYSEEFLGQSLGERQAANLGDGNGQLNQTDILRYNFGDPNYGTLQESINGGSHVRYWKQNGSEADSGAWFVAASVEEPASQNHMIVPNGYDLGRDVFTGNATLSNGTISIQTNRTFSATVEWMDGFLKANSSEGINHAIATDGRVAVLTIKVTGEGSTAAAGTTSSATSLLSSSLPFTTSDRVKVLLTGALGAVAMAVLV